MATAALHVDVYAFEAARKGESFADKFVRALKEHKTEISCGILALNSNTNVSRLYRELAR